MKFIRSILILLLVLLPTVAAAQVVSPDNNKSTMQRVDPWNTRDLNNTPDLGPFGSSFGPLTLSYNDGSITYLGRWTDSGTDIRSGWQGSQVHLLVSGVTSFDVTCDVKDISASRYTFVNYNIDESDYTISLLTTVAETFTGERTATINLPDTGQHRVILKPTGSPDEIFNETEYVKVKSLYFPDGATVSRWDQSSNVSIQTVGDSWMAAFNDWPLFLTNSLFEIHPVAFGGATASTMDARYNYSFNGITAPADDTVDKVVVGLGVNDYNASVTTGAFQTSIESLVAKIRTRQPNATIYLPQLPRNVGAGKNYDQYGTSMSTVASANENVFFIPIDSTEWSTYSWSDDSHLDYASRKLYAEYLESYLLDDYAVAEWGFESSDGTDTVGSNDLTLSGVTFTDYGGDNAMVTGSTGYAYNTSIDANLTGLTVGTIDMVVARSDVSVDQQFPLAFVTYGSANDEIQISLRGNGVGSNRDDSVQIAVLDGGVPKISWFTGKDSIPTSANVFFRLTVSADGSGTALDGYKIYIDGSYISTLDKLTDTSGYRGVMPGAASLSSIDSIGIGALMRATPYVGADLEVKYIRVYDQVLTPGEIDAL